MKRRAASWWGPGEGPVDCAACGIALCGPLKYQFYARPMMSASSAPADEVLARGRRANASVLALESLSVSAGPLAITADVSLCIAAGEMVGLVGESGCGKSLTAQSIMRLLPEPQIRIAAGRILFGGRDLAQASA